MKDFCMDVSTRVSRLMEDFLFVNSLNGRFSVLVNLLGSSVYLMWGVLK